MTYTHYSRDGSGGFAVEAALVKAGAAHEVIVVDTAKGEQNRPDFVAISPMRQVPVLLLPAGAAMTESAAIVVHLANAIPDKRLAPQPATPAHAEPITSRRLLAVTAAVAADPLIGPLWRRHGFKR